MKNILILNFGTSHDVIISANMIAAYKEEHPSANIELLTFENNRTTAENLNGLTKIHTVDSNLISTIMKNALYSDGFAVNSFTESLNDVYDRKWDDIINYSNDTVSAFIISAIESESKLGSFIDAKGIARASNKWSIYQNFVASNQTRNNIGKANMRNHIAGMPLYLGAEKIKVNEEYSVVAAQNFARIRQMNGSPATIVVGINLAAGYDGYNISQETYKDLIETLEDSKDFKPVLLLNGKNYQRELVNTLNQEFDNKLISINIDTVALPSVVSNIDVMISASNDQLAFADAMDTKAIELREFNSEANSTILTHEGCTSIQAKENRYIASDIILALNEEFRTELPIDYMNSPNPICQTVKDEYGCFLTQIRGDINIQNEINYHVERSYFFNLLGYEGNQELIDHIKESTDREELLTYITTVKSELTSTVKVLLATLRSLKSMRNSQSNMNSFINYLDTLIKIGKGNSIVSSTVRFFEGKIENIDSEDIETNVKAIENNLFELKADLQKLTGIISEFAEGRSIQEDASVSLQNEA